MTPHMEFQPAATVTARSRFCARHFAIIESLTAAVSLRYAYPAMLNAARIAELLRPFFAGDEIPAAIVPPLQTYLELLLRWNARTNLTAVRDPEQIVTRHFGESLFAARLLRDASAFSPSAGAPPTLADIGSGAGFPGLPIKMLVPHLHVTLIESHNKKATFLREVIRALGLEDAEVFCGRAESWTETATTVTLRAVEKFDTVLPAAANLVSSAGTLCLLAGAGQVQSVSQVLETGWNFSGPIHIPTSKTRIVLMGNRLPELAR